MNHNQKIYIITRRDLSPGAQAVQACHSFREFILEHPDVEHKWYATSNHMCLLSVPDRKGLHDLCVLAQNLHIRYACFYEPDFNDEMTAVTLEPTERARELCEGLPLALMEFSEKK